VNDVAFVRIAAVVEVPEGEIRGECPGDGCSLSDGELDELADAVVCPCDGTAFDLRTGEPVTGPTGDRVTLYQVRVVEDWIEVGPEIGGSG
jgi:nitrite reductase/ring-hydroxylating ferredoxin subunit